MNNPITDLSIDFYSTVLSLLLMEVTIQQLAAMLVGKLDGIFE